MGKWSSRRNFSFPNVAQLVKRISVTLYGGFFPFSVRLWSWILPLNENVFFIWFGRQGFRDQVELSTWVRWKKGFLYLIQRRRKRVWDDGKMTVFPLQDESQIHEVLISMSSVNLEDYYPAIAISVLLRIVNDPTISQHHTTVVQAVHFIFRSLGIKCVPYLPQVIPVFLSVARSSTDMLFREFLLNQLGALVGIVQQHLRPFLPQLVSLIRDFWSCGSANVQSTLIQLLEQLVVALGPDLRPHMAHLIPQLLRILVHDTSDNRNVTSKLLFALLKFGPVLDDYLHTLLAPVLKLLDLK